MNDLNATTLKLTNGQKRLNLSLGQKKQTLSRHCICYDETSEVLLLNPIHLVKGLFQVPIRKLAVSALFVEGMIT